MSSFNKIQLEEIPLNYKKIVQFELFELYVFRSFHVFHVHFQVFNVTHTAAIFELDV